FYAASALDFGAEGVKPAVLDGVFEPRVLALGAVAPVALHGDDGLGHRDRVLRPAEAHDVGGARIGLGLAVGHAHAAADRHVEASDLAFLVEDGDVAEVVGEPVDVVRRRHGDHDLEFSRLVGRAVDRLDDGVVLAAGVLLAVEPNLATGPRVWQP